MSNPLDHPMLSMSSPWVRVPRPVVPVSEAVGRIDGAARYGVPESHHDLVAYQKIAGHTFGMSDESAERFVAMSERDNLRIIRSAMQPEKVAGGLVMVPMGQYFGGRAIPSIGIAAVAVDPAHRAGGAGSKLMSSMLRDIHAAGYPLSALYPATQPIYRRNGYEQAGTRWHVHLDGLSIEAPRNDHEVTEIDPEDPAQFARVARIYTTRAELNNGFLDRQDYVWRRVFYHRGTTMRTFTVHPPGASDAPDGYLTYRLIDNPAGPASQRMEVIDLHATTIDAAARIAAFLRMHRSMASAIELFIAPQDLMFRVLREQWMQVKLKMMWMLRIVDVRQALEARGYTPGIAASVDVEIYGDTVLPEINNRRFRMTVEQGRGTVKADTGKGTLRVHINALASLFSSFLTPAQLAAAGELSVDDAVSDGHLAADAASDAALPGDVASHPSAARLALLFSGPTPWMPDMF
ncbi:MAG: GNAT family N-acetyltransferase [Planctomycetota bacterium]